MMDGGQRIGPERHDAGAIRLCRFVRTASEYVEESG